MRCYILLVVVATLMLLIPAAYANPVTYVANLSASNEIPPVLVPSNGTGLATMILDATAQTLQISVTFSGLTTNDTAAVIHCCLATPFQSASIGVATEVPSFPGFPLGATSGAYASAVFDLTQSTFYNPVFVTLKGSVSAAEAALIAGIENGEAYFNIHTQFNPGGEIRGFFVPAASAIPEPSSLILLCSGLLGFGLALRCK